MTHLSHLCLILFVYFGVVVLLYRKNFDSVTLKSAELVLNVHNVIREIS